MSERVHRVPDAESFEAAKERYATQHGYRITLDTPGKAVAKEVNWGTGWRHLGLLLVTAGFGNVLYLLYRWLDNETVIIQVDPSVGASAEGSV